MKPEKPEIETWASADYLLRTQKITFSQKSQSQPFLDGFGQSGDYVCLKETL
jgi:hypothetical protein